MLTDLVQNALEAGATDIQVDWSHGEGRLVMIVRDNGCGMTEETMRQALDPFETDPEKHPGRTVGLGLPFVKMAAGACGGSLTLDSAVGRGTEVRLELDPAHVDAPPVGDLPGTMAGLMNAAEGCELHFRREESGRTYEVRRSELESALGGLGSAGAISLMKTYFSSNEEAIQEEA